MSDIEKDADFASKATGVRKDFLMGELVVESAMGQNTGKCTYGQIADGANTAHSKGLLSDNAWQTFQQRSELIESIADSLGYNYQDLTVSCNPPYAGTGGAMGIAQFMPDIWMDYSGRVAAIVGKDNPNPWDPKDSIVAMALLLSDTPGVTEHNYWAERQAAKMYLSGTTSTQYDWYADETQYWANNYQKLIG